MLLVLLPEEKGHRHTEREESHVKTETEMELCCRKLDTTRQ